MDAASVTVLAAGSPAGERITYGRLLQTQAHLTRATVLRGWPLQPEVRQAQLAVLINPLGDSPALLYLRTKELFFPP